MGNRYTWSDGLYIETRPCAQGTLVTPGRSESNPKWNSLPFQLFPGSSSRLWTQLQLPHNHRCISTCYSFYFLSIPLWPTCNDSERFVESTIVHIIHPMIIHTVQSIIDFCFGRFLPMLFVVTALAMGNQTRRICMNHSHVPNNNWWYNLSNQSMLCFFKGIVCRITSG